MCIILFSSKFGVSETWLHMWDANACKRSQRVRDVKENNFFCIIICTIFLYMAGSHGAMVARLSSEQKVAGSIPVVVTVIVWGIFSVP